MRAPGFKTNAQPRRRTGRRAAAASGLIAALALLLGISAPAGALSTPNLATFASGTIPVGGMITDTALIGGGTNPVGGTIVFKIYGPGDTKCANPPVFTSPPVKVNVPTVSPPYQASTPGTYQVVAAYSGDANNAAVTGTCGMVGESVVVTQATPTLTTAASAVSSGGTISDTAVLMGGFRPTGTITFRLYGPGDGTCATPIFSAVAAASVSTVSPAYHPTSAGAYHWIATYGGDANNVIVAGSCTDPAETVTVTGVPTGPTGPVAQQPACTQATAQALANSVLAALASALSGSPATGFKTTCSAGLRIVLRAKEIRPGNRGSPRHDGFTTIANNLTHTTTTGQLAFSLNAQGTALKAYASSSGKSITAFAIVHVRPDRTLLSSEALQILTLA